MLNNNTDTFNNLFDVETNEQIIERTKNEIKEKIKTNVKDIIAVNNSIVSSTAFSGTNVHKQIRRNLLATDDLHILHILKRYVSCTSQYLCNKTICLRCSAKHRFAAVAKAKSIFKWGTNENSYYLTIGFSCSYDKDKIIDVIRNAKHQLYSVCRKYHIKLVGNFETEPKHVLDLTYENNKKGFEKLLRNCGENFKYNKKFFYPHLHAVVQSEYTQSELRDIFINLFQLGNKPIVQLKCLDKNNIYQQNVINCTNYAYKFRFQHKGSFGKYSNVYDSDTLSNIVYIFDKLGYDGLKLVCKS